jgi:hypothetical protein
MSDELIEVSRDEFFAVVGPLDVTPRALPDRTEWETGNRRFVGRSYPGYKMEGPCRWLLAPASRTEETK